MGSKLACWWFGSICMLILNGCGSSSNRQALEGVVTFEGEPLAQGSIRFRPLAGTPGPTAGSQIREGKFSVAPDQGTFLGKFRVEITATRKTGNTNRSTFAGIEVDEDEYVQFIPARYNLQSELVREVSSGGPNRFEFALTLR